MNAKNLAAAAVFAFGLAGCAETNDDVDTNQNVNAAFCSNPAEGLVLLDDVEANANRALQYMEVAAGLADEDTVTAVRTELMRSFLEGGHDVSAQGVNTVDEFGTKDLACESDENYSYCEGSFYYPAGPSFDDDKKVEHRTDSKSRVMFYVTGKAWEAAPEKPLPVQLEVQCGEIEWSGTDNEYVQSGDGEYDYVDVDASQKQTFCTFVTTVDGQSFNGIWPAGETVEASETVIGDKVNSSVYVPVNPLYGTEHQSYGDKVTVLERANGDVAFVSAGQGDDVEEATICDATQQTQAIEKPKGVVSSVAARLKVLMQKLIK